MNKEKTPTLITSEQIPKAEQSLSDEAKGRIYDMAAELAEQFGDVNGVPAVEVLDNGVRVNGVDYARFELLKAANADQSSTTELDSSQDEPFWYYQFEHVNSDGQTFTENVVMAGDEATKKLAYTVFNF